MDTLTTDPELVTPQEWQREVAAPLARVTQNAPRRSRPYKCSKSTQALSNSTMALWALGIGVGVVLTPLRRDLYRHRPVQVCRKPRQPLSRVWSDFKRFHH